MVKEKMDFLKKKLDAQILKNERYEDIYETSRKIDKLIVEYYKSYGLTGIK